MGAPSIRAKAIIALPLGSFDLKTLVTEDNLKKVGLLSSRVGSICLFYKFKNGKAIKYRNDDDDDDLEEVEDEVELPQDAPFQENMENLEQEHSEPSAMEAEDSEKTIEDGRKDASFVLITIFLSFLVVHILHFYFLCICQASSSMYFFVASKYYYSNDFNCCPSDMTGLPRGFGIAEEVELKAPSSSKAHRTRPSRKEVKKPVEASPKSKQIHLRSHDKPEGAF